MCVHTEHESTREAGLWGADARGRLQAAAGLQQEGTSPERFQEPVDLQRQDQGVSDAAAEATRGAGHDGSGEKVGRCRL